MALGIIYDLAGFEDFLLVKLDGLHPRGERGGEAGTWGEGGKARPGGKGGV